MERIDTGIVQADYSNSRTPNITNGIDIIVFHDERKIDRTHYRGTLCKIIIPITEKRCHARYISRLERDGVHGIK